MILDGSFRDSCFVMDRDKLGNHIFYGEITTLIFLNSISEGK